MDLNLHFLDYMFCRAFWGTKRGIKDNEQVVYHGLNKRQNRLLSNGLSYEK